MSHARIRPIPGSTNAASVKQQDRQKLRVHFVGEFLGIVGLGVNATRGQRLEHTVEAVVLWRRGAPRLLAITTPEDGDPVLLHGGRVVS